MEKFKNKLTSKLPNWSYSDDRNQPYNSVFAVYCIEFYKTFLSKQISDNGTATFREWATKGIHNGRVKLYGLYEDRNYNKSKEYYE